MRSAGKYLRVNVVNIVWNVGTLEPVDRLLPKQGGVTSLDLTVGCQPQTNCYSYQNELPRHKPSFLKVSSQVRFLADNEPALS